MFTKLFKNSNITRRCYSDFQKAPPENPIKRTLRILGNDMKMVASVFTNKQPNIKHYELGNTDIDNFPTHTDVVIIGGGVIGSSIAYWLKEKSAGGLGVAVVEKDSTYSKCSTVLSVGGLRQQFSLPENIEMSRYGAEFFRTAKKRLNVDVQFTPSGYLLLADEGSAAILEENHKIQKSLGVKNELLSADALKSKFPWLSTTDIILGCHGLENEGWFDPWSLLQGFKHTALKLDCQYVDGEVLGFGFEDERSSVVPGSDNIQQRMKTLFVQTADNRIREINFAICIIAAGAESGRIAKMAKIGAGEGLLSIPLPVEPRKRFVYCYNTQDPGVPGFNTPLTIDPSGTYFRREGLGNNFIAGRSPALNKEPSTDDLEVDYDFFHNEVWPHLANRVPAFEGVKVNSAWAGFYEYNTFDENGIIGVHPYHGNLFFATGFSGHGIQQAPAVGLAISELILNGSFKTIDLTRLGFSRFVTKIPMYETNIF